MVLRSVQAPTLGGRVAGLVEAYWGQRGLRRAAADLGVSHPTLSRVVNDHDTDARFLVIDAFNKGLDVPFGWLAGESKEHPPTTDLEGRPLVAGVPRWRRALAKLELDGPMHREVAELPYAVWRYASLVGGELVSHPKRARDYKAVTIEHLTESLNIWSALMEASEDAIGQAGMAVLLQKHRLRTQLLCATGLGGRGFEREFGSALKKWFDEHHSSRRA